MPGIGVSGLNCDATRPKPCPDYGSAQAEQAKEPSRGGPTCPPRPNSSAMPSG